MKRTGFAQRTTPINRGNGFKATRTSMPRKASGNGRATDRHRDSAITRLAHVEGIACTLRVSARCYGDVFLCHLRGVWALGMGTKPADWCGLYACHGCHDVLDKRVPGECSAQDVLRAFIESLGHMIKHGVMPKGETA